MSLLRIPFPLSAGMLVAACVCPLVAQTPKADSVSDAAATITPATVAQQLGALTADSFRHRDTPSLGLERMARYVADEFHRLGLEPGVRTIGNEPLSWFQRYAIPGQRRASSTLLVMVRPQRHGRNILTEANGLEAPLMRGIWLPFDTGAGVRVYFAPEVGRQALARQVYGLMNDPFAIGKPLVVLSGCHTVASITRLADSLAGNVALYVPPVGLDTTTRRQILTTLYTISQRVLVVSPDTGERFTAAAVQAARRQPIMVVDDYLRYATGPRTWPWAVWVRPEVMQEVLEVAANLDMAQLRRDTTPAVRTLQTTSVMFSSHLLDLPPDSVTAPNVVGLLQGADPRLQKEYVVISAHMDNACGAGDGPSDALGASPADSAAARARIDDNVAGVAALLTVARAFAHAGRPQRSILFVATSGGTCELWGANRFADRGFGLQARVENLVLDLNLDHLAPLERSPNDTVFIDGLNEVELPMSPVWVAATHPELRLTIASGGTAVRPVSDHFAFARAAIPSVHVHTARIADSLVRASIEPDTINARALPSADLVARVARLVFEVGEQAADAPRAARWTAAGRQHLVDLLNVNP